MDKKAVELSEIQDAFNPNPLMSQEELKDFYLNTSLARTGDAYSDYVETVLTELINSKTVFQHKLFIGHPGCGKTTELFQLMRRAQESGFAVCLGRCDLELDSADIEYTDVLFLILDELIQMCEKYQFDFNEDLVQSIRDYWNRDVELINTIIREEEQTLEGEMSGTVGLKSILAVMARIKGVIKNSSDSRKQIRQHIEPSSSEMIRRIQDVIEMISAECEKAGKKRTPLVILDGLDKIPLKQAKEIFRENGSRFSLLKMHLIITFPISLTYSAEYSDIQTWFPNPNKLPMIKLRKWEKTHYAEDYREGMNSMRGIVEKRAELTLFEKDVLEELIQKTGGYIRDLFRCISTASLRASMRKADAISMEDARMALNNLESDLNGRYDDAAIPIMRRIYKGEKYVTPSEEMTKLLQIGAVLEYNGERWCDLHPLVEKWLFEHGKIE